MSRRVVVPAVVLALTAACVAAAPAGAFGDREPPEPNATTPDGAATLEERWTGAVPAIALPPAVLMGVQVAVGAGGQAGEVRVRVPDRRPGAAAGAQVVGPWTTLPAEPGLRRLEVPRVPWNELGDGLSIDQRTGGLRILRMSPCTPERGEYADLCQIQHVVVHAPFPPDAGPFGTPTSELPGTELTAEAITDPDLDHDLRGDRTEEPAGGGSGPDGGADLPAAKAPTDLRVTGRAQRLPGGRVRLRITVKNRGPATARTPRLELGAPGRTGTCAPSRSPSAGPTTGRRCVLPELRAGRSRTVTHTLRRGARPGRLSVRAFGDRPNLRRGWGLDRIHLRVR